MKERRISLIIEDLAGIAVLCYWLSILYYYIVGMSGNMLNLLRLFFSTPAFIFVLFKPKTREEKWEFCKQIVLLFILLILGWLSSTYNHNSTYLAYGFMILSNAGIALFMYYYKISERGSLSLFLILSIILTGYYIIHRNLYEVFAAGNLSRNYVSVFLLCFIILIYISCRSNKVLLNFLPVIVLLFSCMAGGRGGILSAVIFNIFYFFIIMKYAANREKIYYILGLWLVFILLLFIYQFGNWMRLVRFLIGKFANTGFGADMDRIAYRYKPYILECKHFENMLFGANIRSIINDHLHNTYLMAHARFGILGLLIFIVLFVRAIIYSWKKQNKFLAALILTLMIRIFTDTIFTMLVFDSIFFYILFLGLSRNRRARQMKNL